MVLVMVVLQALLVMVVLVVVLMVQLTPLGKILDNKSSCNWVGCAPSFTVTVAHHVAGNEVTSYP
jgi:hypothetical protein